MMKSCKAYTCVLVCGLLVTQQVADSAESVATNDLAAGTITDAEIKTMLRDYIDTDKLGVGLIVGIVDEHGSRTIGHGKPGNGKDGEVDGDTVFEIGSITKVFTALLLQTMVESGEMRLDDPVQKYLPDSVKVPTYQGKQITLLHLATHTSALPGMPSNLSPRSWKDPDQADYSPEQLYAFLSHYTLRRAPSSEAAYSNLGMMLLGHVIALKAGKDYETLVLERICQPLGMNSTRIVLTPEMNSRLAIGHAIPGRPVNGMNFRFLPGAGGLRSTANDLLKFVSAYVGLNPSPLSAVMEKSKELHPIESGAKLMLAWGGDNSFFGHNGGTYGCKTILGFDPKQRRGFVVLSNCRNSVIVDAMAGPLRTAFTPKPRQTIPSDAPLYDRYVGQYELDKKSSICTVRREGQRLLVQWIEKSGARTPTYELFRQTETDFRNEFWGVHARFSPATKERGTELVLSSIGPYSGITDPLTLKRISGHVPEPAPAPIQLKSDIYDRYVGQYRKTFLFGLIKVGPILSITHEADELGNHLIASARGVPGYDIAEFFPVTENSFIVNPITTGDDIRLTFLRIKKNKATRGRVYWNGRNLTGSKVSDTPAK